MTIDLSTLNPGDTVVHRNGGRSKIQIKVSYDDSCDLHFYGPGSTACRYWFNGKYAIGEHPFDIISIESVQAKQTPLEEWLYCYNPKLARMDVLTNMGMLHQLAQAISDTLKEMEKK